MLRTIVRIAARLLVALILVVATLYLFFGLRFVMDGGGMPHPRFVQSSEQQAERIRRHREEQRAQLPASAASSAAAAVTPEPSSTVAQPTTTNRSPAAAAPAILEGPAVSDRSNAYWTDFRGPLRNGEYLEGPLVTNWSSGGLKPIWKQPTGGGYASFVVARGRAFTIEQRGHEEVAAAYDVATGRELWTNTWAAEFQESMGGDGPRATPTWASNVVYALGATGELRALEDATGRIVWRTNILQDSGAPNLPWGMAAAPLVVDDALIVLPGGSNGRSVVAYDRRTGKRLWSSLGDQQAYSSPMLVTLDGVRQILVFSATRLTGLSVDRGDLLWEYQWVGFNGINAAQPLLLGNNRVFLSSSYGLGSAVIEVSRGSSGFSVREVWRNTRMKNRFASSVLHEGTIYGLDESILAAVDASTGDLKWKGGRYGYGQLLLAHGHLIVLTEDGDLALVRARPDRHEEIVRFPVLSGKTWNPPAIAGGYLLVRNLAEMAAFDLRVR